ncbi:uncharacterized protein LOC143611621 [Bidens hawaiensis]|uniref:uncharacterized protein LOC143611621 n=1 Tax=Bidens hawaiensis TaxID=980011 RepID=UPI00404A9C5D
MTNFCKKVSSSVSKVSNFCKKVSSKVRMTCFRAFFPVLLFIALMMLFYLLCHVLGNLIFFDVISKVAGTKALSLLFSKMGCSSALASVIGCAFRALVTAGVGANMMPSGGEIIPSNSGSGGSSHSKSWTEDSFSIGVLMEPFPETSTEGASTASADAGPVPHGNAVSNSTEGPASPGRFPYEADQLIGGDSVSSIQRRLLASKPFPSAEEIDFAHMQAEDLFKVKVHIIRQMEGLDPTGDWMRQGARALDSPNSSTRESSLERLYSLLDDLSRKGKRSKAFFSLSENVALRKGDLDEGSSA